MLIAVQIAGWFPDAKETRLAWLMAAGGLVSLIATPGDRLRDQRGVGNGRLGAEASWSHLAMWAMLEAPLIAGNDLATMSAQTRRILLDPTLVALAQDPHAGSGAIVARRPGLDVWRRDPPPDRPGCW